VPRFTGCGGRLRVIAFIGDGVASQRILGHLIPARTDSPCSYILQAGQHSALKISSVLHAMTVTASAPTPYNFCILTCSIQTLSPTSILAF